MPKLDKDQAKSVAENEGGFPLLDEGVYFGTLEEVKVSDGPGASGFDYWTWIFGDLVNEDTNQAVTGKAFSRTSLSPQAEWKMKEHFDAFGVPADTDTDELLGSDCRLAISQQPIPDTDPPRLSNNVDAVLPLTDEAPAPAPAPAPAKKTAARKPATRKR